MRRINKIPVLGDKRMVKEFAWLPTQVGDHEIWLEHYLSEEVYEEWMDDAYHFTRGWVCRSRRLIEGN